MKRFILSAVAVLVVAGAIFITWFLATLYMAGPPQQGYLALTGATVLAGEDLDSLSNSTILIRDGVIVETGQEGNVVIPPETEILDISGYTVLPGLIDLHLHLASPETNAEPNQEFLQPLNFTLNLIRFMPDKRTSFLEHGVTTIRDLGSEYDWITNFRKMMHDGTLEVPHLFAAGPFFTTTGGHPVVTIGVDPNSNAVRLPDSVDEARRMVTELGENGNYVDLIKVVQDCGNNNSRLQLIPQDILRAIVDEAHNHNFPVVAHWGTQDDLNNLLKANVDELQHLEAQGLVDGWPKETLNQLVNHDIPVSPTLRATEVALPKKIVNTMQQRVYEYHDSGGRITAGSDAGMPGVSSGSGLHQELELLVENGFTPLEAIKTATIESAKVPPG